MKIAFVAATSRNNTYLPVPIQCLILQDVKALERWDTLRRLKIVKKVERMLYTLPPPPPLIRQTNNWYSEENICRRRLNFD